MISGACYVSDDSDPIYGNFDDKTFSIKAILTTGCFNYRTLSIGNFKNVNDAKNWALKCKKAWITTLIGQNANYRKKLIIPQINILITQ